MLSQINLFLLPILLIGLAIIQAEENASLTQKLTVTLPSGDRMPVIGFGTYRLRGDSKVKQALDNALGVGYRLFDTAEVYENEESIGKALKELLPKHNLTRKDIFITSKVASRPESSGANSYESLRHSLTRLDTSYVDLYLIHSPEYFSHSVANGNFNFSKIRDETWKQLAKAQKDGLTRNIGVSNFHINHLAELLSNDHGVKPAVNQVQWNPEHHRDNLLEFCRSHNIALQAYFSLGGDRNKINLLENAVVKKVAEKLGKTPGQVLLRWAVQQNVLVIPKSLNRVHMIENLDLNFKISDEDMKNLSNLQNS
ncbi:unnamed protein product [Phyllotreta striolata]|uniref:NADP-dependent oxidoreductase domain-containing protein n=1 Tax=Phyllotreta striolata TaxID=444603 RepID=A0A9N9TSF6_PHYSR|nr:unnamed protein product [Phyllotreta striolata]